MWPAWPRPRFPVRRASWPTSLQALSSGEWRVAGEEKTWLTHHTPLNTCHSPLITCHSSLATRHSRLSARQPREVVPLAASAQGVILPQGVGREFVRHQDSPQVGVAVEADAEHVEHLALHPVGTGP